MANENCLVGMACPKCRSEEPFEIEVTTLVEVADDGTDFPQPGSDAEWGDDSFCRCCNCKHAARVQDFYTGGA